MKHFSQLAILFLSMTAFAQSQEHAGNYEMELGNIEQHFETYKLTLNPNGTFLFSWYRYVAKGTPQEERKYGKGSWTSNQRLIFLKVDETHMDATHTLNLNKTKLRYDTKSPRDKSNREIKTTVRFLESDIFWIKGKTFIKNMTVSLKAKEPQCCNTIKDVESLLNGKWKSKKNDNKEYHYTFKDEKGVFIAYIKNGEEFLEEINKNQVFVKILKTEDGFQIEQNFDGLKIYSDIKYLDATKLITVRRDGKESELFRIND